MSDTPDIHVYEIGSRDGPQNLGEGLSAIRRRRCGHRAHIPAKHRTTHLHKAGIPKALWRFA
jgi:hypothetical protein